MCSRTVGFALRLRIPRLISVILTGNRSFRRILRGGSTFPISLMYSTMLFQFLLPFVSRAGDCLLHLSQVFLDISCFYIFWAFFFMFIVPGRDDFCRACMFKWEECVFSLGLSEILRLFRMYHEDSMTPSNLSP